MYKNRGVILLKRIGNFILDLIIGAWLVVAIFVTVCLLSYNDFNVSMFGKTSLLIIDSDFMEPDYYEGDLLFIKRNNDSKINPGDKVFYYNSALTSSVFIYLDTVSAKEPVTKDETTFIIDGQRVSGEYVIGKVDSTKVYHKLGTYLAIFTSRWGFMFLVIFPTLFAIIYEIMMIVEARQDIRAAAREELLAEGKHDLQD